MQGYRNFRRNQMKRTLSSFVYAIIFVFISSNCSNTQNEKNETKDYQPTEEFIPVFNAMTEKQTEKLKVDYGIEETVRILNGLELAQHNSENFNDFLIIMAKQDYSRVPKEVVDVKLKLLPILQQMYELQSLHKELDSWSIFKNSALNALTDPQFTSNATAIALSVGSPATALSSGIKAGIDIQKKVAEKLENKKQIKKQLDEIQKEYIDYLMEYYPIYTKYMKEWDKLCLLKDKAYLDVFSGRMLDAYNTTNQILEKYPNNRETLLLNALSAIYIAPQTQEDVIVKSQKDTISTKKETEFSENIDSITVNLQLEKPKVEFHSKLAEKETEKWNPMYLEADMTLDKYLELYPDYSAPAFLLKGVLCLHLSKNDQALSYFDLASAYYPNQAEKLTDLLDAYSFRTYLNKSQEGQYLLKLYRSTMEGYGVFSPNFHKAFYYMNINELDKSQEEIYKHFFRRGNQGVYDCLLTDVEYCEKTLYPSFKRMVIEQSFINLNYTRKGNDKILVKISNNSDVDLENIRVYLCIHYTDMYPDEYDVVKMPFSVSRIKAFSQDFELGKLKLEYQNKKNSDIVKVKAIVMTDNKICWIDNIEQRISDIKPFYKFDKLDINNVNEANKELFVKSLNFDESKIKSLLKDGLKLISKDKENWLSNVTNVFSKNKFGIELPRELALISPVFSINNIKSKDKVETDECILDGESIKMNFDFKPKEGEIIPFYIYSDFYNFKINLMYENSQLKIKDIETIK